jgi:methionine-rich copper-binding protein CopC
VNSNLVLTFNENIKVGTGSIMIYKSSDDTVARSIAITDTQVSISGATLTINLTNNFSNNKSYYMKIAAGVIKDIAGNNYAGLLTNADYNFTTIAAADTAAPTLSTKAPADNATNVPVNSNLVLTFNENIKVGSGSIVVYKTSDNSIAKTIAITDTQVSISGATLTINPTNDFSHNKSYYVKIAAGVIKDIAGNDYAGLLTNADYNFTTAP